MPDMSLDNDPYDKAYFEAIKKMNEEDGFDNLFDIKSAEEELKKELEKLQREVEKLNVKESLNDDFNRLWELWARSKPYTGEEGEEPTEARTAANQEFFALAHKLLPLLMQNQVPHFTVSNIASIKVLDKDEQYAILIDGEYEAAQRLVEQIYPWLNSHEPIAFIYIGDKIKGVEFKPRDSVITLLGDLNNKVQSSG